MGAVLVLPVFVLFVLFFNRAAVGVHGLCFALGFLTAQPKACAVLVLHVVYVTHIVFFFVCKIYFLLVLMMFSIRSTRTCPNMQGLHHW